MDELTLSCNDAAYLTQELHSALMEVKESMEGRKELMTWDELVNELYE